MKAIVMHEHGGREVLRWAEVETPEPGPGEVRMRVRAAGLNHFDIDIREGVSGMTHQMPHRLGLEAAGEVDAVGEGVADRKPGDRVAPTFLLSDGRCAACRAGDDHLCEEGGVLGVTHPGAYAEYVVVPAHDLVPMPANLEYHEAAAVLVTMGTAWEMAVEQARIQPHETVLVNGAGGGIGSSAVQIAKLLGARVIASAGSEAKGERARELGADETIDYSREDLAARVRELTGGRGVEVVLESVGGAVLLSSLEALAVGGRAVTCGAHAGERVELDVVTFFRKHVTLHGTHGAPKAVIARVFQLVAEGRLQAVIHSRLPLQEAAEAHRMMEEREIFGKVVLEP